MSNLDRFQPGELESDDHFVVVDDEDADAVKADAVKDEDVE